MIRLQDIRDRIQLGTDEEPFVQSILDSTVEMFEQQTQRKWLKRTDYVQEFYLQTDDQRWAKKLWVDLFPITAITIKEWYEWEDETADADTLTATSSTATGDFRCRTDRGVLIRIRNTKWKHFVKVTSTGGYDYPSFTGSPVLAPADVREALIRQVIFTKKRIEGDSQVAESKSFQGGSITYTDPMLDALYKQIVKTHMRRSYAGQ